MTTFCYFLGVDSTVKVKKASEFFVSTNRDLLL